MRVKSTSKQTARVSIAWSFYPAARRRSTAGGDGRACLALLVRTGDGERRTIRYQVLPRLRVHVLERHLVDQPRQPDVVVEAEAEELRVLEEGGNGGVRLERPGHRAHEVLFR